MAETPSRYCSNCGQELGDEAVQFCPNCGRPTHATAHVPTPEADVPVPPPPGQQAAGGTTPPQPQQVSAPRQGRSTGSRILIGCAALVILPIVLVGCFALLSGGGGETGGGNGGGGEEAQDSGQGEGGGGPDPASVGEEVPVGDAVYTVTKVGQETKLVDPSGFDDPVEGNFLIVDFTVENRGDEPMSVSDLGLYVYDDQDRQFETETEVPLGYIPENKDLFLLDRINPGLSQEVQVVFSVPPDSKNFEMEVSSGLFDTEPKRIALGV